MVAKSLALLIFAFSFIAGLFTNPLQVDAASTCNLSGGKGTMTLQESVISLENASDFTFNFTLNRDALEAVRGEAYVQAYGYVFGAKTKSINIDELEFSVPINASTIDGKAEHFNSVGKHTIGIVTGKVDPCTFEYVIKNTSEVTQPELDLNPKAFKKSEAPEFVDVRIDAGAKVGDSYTIFFGAFNRIEDAQGKEYGYIKCPNRKDCAFQPYTRGGAVSNPKISTEGDRTIFTFQIQTAPLVPRQYSVAVVEENSQARLVSFFINDDIKNPLQMEITDPPKSTDPSNPYNILNIAQSGGATIKIKVSNPETRDYKIEFKTNSPETINPPTPILSCNKGEPDKCTGEFRLPKGGLNNGVYGVKLLNKNDSELRAEANLKIEGDPAKQPSLTAKSLCSDPAVCTKATANLCDIRTGKALGEGDSPFAKPEEATEVLKKEDTGFMTAIGCIPAHPVALINGFLKFFAGAAGGIALLMMIYGSYQMITSQGDANMLKNGREQFIAAVVGILFVLFSVIILQIIGVDILNLPGFKK